jgi:hypothetical protein
LVFFGTPGRLVKGRIAPTTAGNLGSSFDGVCPQEELSRRLNQEVHAVNDAIAQMGAGLNALLHVPDFGEKLKGKKVAYVGPGTGLGGGFGVVNHDYSLDYFTDGHIFDMQVPGYTGTSVKFSVPSVKGHAEIQSRFAEDVLSGRAVRQIACAIDRHLIQHDKEPLFLPLVLGYSKMSPKDRERALDHYNNKSPVDAHLVGVEVLGKEKPAGKVRKAFPVAEMISDFEGEMLGRLVQCIYTGSIIKATEGAQWPPDDARKVSGITDYLIGGSVGTKGEMGRIVRETAVHYLKGVFPNTEFNFFVIGDCKNAGALGTAAFLKRQDILGAMRVLSDSS